MKAAILALAIFGLLSATANAAVCAKTRTTNVGANNTVFLWGCVVEGNPYFSYTVANTDANAGTWKSVIGYNFACINNAAFTVASKFNPGSASFPPIWTAASVPPACSGPGTCTSDPVLVPAALTPVCVMVVCTSTVACNNLKVTIAAGSSMADVLKLDGSPAPMVLANYAMSLLLALLAFAMF
jgi:hypothetical protein